jgi:hypothetical protein
LGDDEETTRRNTDPRERLANVGVNVSGSRLFRDEPEVG